MDDSATSDAPKLRVFLSYSRKDREFTTWLADALIARGYLADYDQSSHDKANVETGISAEDEWWQRVQEMVAAADVTVFVVSPDSAASKVCDEEIAYARGLGKRVIPVLRRMIDFAAAPPRLSALNMKISFVDDARREAALEELAAALDRDVAWLREQTRLTLAAADWEKSERREDELLRGAEISEAEAWSARRPASAPEVSETVLAFLAESRKAQGEREARERAQLARQRGLQRWVGGLVGVALVVTLAGAWLVMQGQRQLAQRTSAAIAQEAGQAFEQGRYDRALRLGVLAARDTWLSPSVREAGFEIGKALEQSQVEARFAGLNGIDCMAVNADGSLAATVTKDVPHVLARAASGEWVEEALPGYEENTGCVAFAPDGASFVTTGVGAAMVWTRDRAAWKPQRLEAKEAETVYSPYLLANGRVVAAMETTVVVWTPDGKGGWARAMLEDDDTAQADGESLNYVRASADGRRVLSVSTAAMQLWSEADDGTWSAMLVGRPKAAIPFAALSEDGKRIIIDTGRAVRVLIEDAQGNWNADATAAITPEEANRSFAEIAASPNGRMVLTVEYGGVTKLWTDTDGAGVYAKAPVGGLDGVSGFEFGPAGRVFYGTNAARELKLWTIDDMDEAGQPMIDEAEDVLGPATIVGEERISDQAVSADGLTVATAGYPAPLEIWKLKPQAAGAGVQLTSPDVLPLEASAAGWSPSGAHLAVVDIAGQFVVWARGADGKWAPETAMSGLAARYAGMPDEDTVITDGSDGLNVFTRAKGGAWGEGQWTQAKLHENSDASVGFSRGGASIVAQSDTLEATVWTRAGDAWTSMALNDGDASLVEKTTMSADGAVIVSLSNNNLIAWRREGGAWTPREIENEPYFGMDSAHFGAEDAFVTAGDNGVLVWTPKADGTWAFERVSGSEYPAMAASLAPGGRSIVSVTANGPARIWSRREDGKWVSAVLAGGEAASSGSFSPDGKSVVLAMKDGARVIDVARLAPGGDEGAVRRMGGELAKEACGARLGGAGEGGMRRLSAKDVEASPIVGGREGEDVCAWSPAWYDRVLGAVLGWMG